MADSGSRIIPSDEFTADDHSALAWAASTEHPAAVAAAIRFRSGADANISVAELAAIRRDWEAGGRPQPKPHVHRTPVRFADGTTVMGVRFLGDDPYLRQDAPGFGLYLDERRDPPWPHEHLDWPDFGVPEDLDELHQVLRDLLDRARKGERVEVGCLGGHGRTGTALACLAVLTGTPADDAVTWVRANYCYKAVETDAQEQLVATFHSRPDCLPTPVERRGIGPPSASVATPNAEGFPELCADARGPTDPRRGNLAEAPCPQGPPHAGSSGLV